ncbi:hypothetical protein LMH87_000778 [Akanthomyces muscarius]|uniref:Uncharacterized protein n=1 Tax=Akanthomyces muscarius TaxID=2231603 RepID=A0A9W8UP07_AKAMU|nr:hypothetical protein LMH87_000778 [Akanthomyces muscarius]KAJ4155539.1 hypothetical protein LMH87_000778 [Akanthomyces muscarius]
MPRGYDWHGGQDGATSELALAFPPEPIAVRVSFFPLLFSAWVWWSLCDAANQVYKSSSPVRLNDLLYTTSTHNRGIGTIEKHSTTAYFLVFITRQKSLQQYG